MGLGEKEGWPYSHSRTTASDDFAFCILHLLFATFELLRAKAV